MKKRPKSEQIYLYYLQEIASNHIESTSRFGFRRTNIGKGYWHYLLYIKIKI